MWFVGGSKTKVRPVKGGRTGQRRCEGCQAVVTFRECEVVDGLHLFGVELFDVNQRRMVCATCGEDHDVDAFFKTTRPQATAALAARSAAPEKASGSDKSVEDELAALKRRLAKKG